MYGHSETERLAIASPVHCVPIPPDPCEVGDGDRPEGGVPEEVVEGVPGGVVTMRRV